MTKISIIITSYNYAQYIEQTISSVIKQNYTDWEMLIIDDGSKDNSVNIIQEYAQRDSRIILLTHPNNENRGLSETLKLGISQAKGEYIVFLESDDYIREDYLNKKLDIFLKNAEVGFIYNDIQTFGAKPTIRRKIYFNIVRSYWKKHNYPHYISENLYFRNIVPTFSCVMLKKYLLQDLNWNSPDKACIDWWLWAQISQKTKYYFSPEKLTFWRLHNDSYINLSAKEEKTILFLLSLYKLLPPIQKLSSKIKFILKQLLITFKYRTNTLGNIMYIFKGK